MPCRAQVTKHARFCDLAAAGDTRYEALLCGETPEQPDPDRAAVLARRARKMRVALGVKVPPGRR
jgi:hypothetical protein